MTFVSFIVICLFMAVSLTGVSMGKKTSCFILSALIVLCLATKISFAKQVAYESIEAGTATATNGTSTYAAAAYDKYAGTDVYGSLKAEYHVENQSIRYLATGSTPSSTDGILVASGGSFTLEQIEDVRRCKFIGISGTATVKIIYDETKK